LVTFFAAAKKVTPPPGRRLLNKKSHTKEAAGKQPARQNPHPREMTFRKRSHQNMSLAAPFVATYDQSD
jgi:hypothetical protein